MTKEVFSIHIADVSAFARQLGRALQERHAERPLPPGHTELLNLIARTQGQRNWQALRVALRAAPHPEPAATRAVEPPVASASPTSSPRAGSDTLSATARRALGQFDELGRLRRWPARYSVQRLVMWVLWTRFDAKRSYTEPEVNAVLKSAHLFGDHVTLRRELINHRLMSRRSDGSDYRKLPLRPDDEARALLTAWRAQLRAAEA